MQRGALHNWQGRDRSDQILKLPNFKFYKFIIVDEGMKEYNKRIVYHSSIENDPSLWTVKFLFENKVISRLKILLCLNVKCKPSQRNTDIRLTYRFIYEIAPLNMILR